MTDPTSALTRRDFLKDSSAAAVAASTVPFVHSGGDDIKIALVGCGGRGSGAARNAMSVQRGPVQLVAMADLFDHRLKHSYTALSKRHAAQMDVPEERKFLGFDAYKSAMDCLKPGDVVILTTPPAFRWVHFKYAIEKGLNVFMEKPLSVDGPASRRMLELAQQAEAKNLKVGVGLMSRHSVAMQELKKRVDDGAIGEIISQRGYRMQGPIVYFRSEPKPDGISEMDYQIQRFHSFLWASGGAFNDFFIHIIDQMCWMKGEWPVQCHALGGRHYKESKEGVLYVDQNLDCYAVEYTYADGTKFHFDGRNQKGCQTIFSSAMHGTKGAAIVSKSSDCGRPSSIHKKHDLRRDSEVWRSKVPRDKRNPYQNEWEVLIGKIRDNQPHNEVKRGVEGSLVTSMGRMAAHTGRRVTFDQMLNCEHEFSPGIDKFTADSKAPLQPDANGQYPKPQPGLKRKREY